MKWNTEVLSNQFVVSLSPSLSAAFVFIYLFIYSFICLFISFLIDRRQDIELFLHKVFQKGRVKEN